MKIAVISSAFIDGKGPYNLIYQDREIRSSCLRKNIEHIMLDPSKIMYGLINNVPFVDISDASFGIKSYNISIQDIDAIIVRKTRDFVNQIIDILVYISKVAPQIIIHDPLESFDQPLSKTINIAKRSGLFNQPDTFVTSGKYLPSDIQFPVVVKPTHGYLGELVEECKDKNQLLTFLKNHPLSKQAEFLGYGYLVQQRLNIDEEYRVIVIGGQAIGCVRKFSNNIAANAAQGGIFENYELLKNSEIRRLAEAVTSHSKLSFAGVDIANVNSSYYLLECNRSPDFSSFDKATGLCTSDFIVDYVVESIKSRQPIEPINDLLAITKVDSKRPRVFIGCSTKELATAKHLVSNLRHSTETTIWSQGVFGPTRGILEELVEKAKRFDYAILLLSPDDKTEKKGEIKKSPRDNIIFELGLFIGTLGRDKTFIVYCEDDDIHIPSDFDGVKMIGWKRRVSNDLEAAIGEAAIAIEKAIGVL